MTGPEVRGFRIRVPDADVGDLRDRLQRTRWPEAETRPAHGTSPSPHWAQGVPLDYLRDLADH